MKYIGVDLGGTNIAVGLVNEQGEIVAKLSTPTINSRPANQILDDIAKLSLDVLEKAGVPIQDVHSIGIGTPGYANSDTGVVVYANNLHFENVEMAKHISDITGLRVFIDNDANCAALGEAVYGAAKGVKSSITITLGTGVGSGVIIDGKIFNGYNHAAAEIGHMTINFDGVMCTCGRKGCWERYASGTALIQQTIEAGEKNPDSSIPKFTKDGTLKTASARTAFDAARAGDKVAAEVCEQYIKYIAEGMANVVNIFQPEIVVLGGGVANEGENILEPLREYVRKLTYGQNINEQDFPRTKFVKAILGNDAGIVGAAMLGME